MSYGAELVYGDGGEGLVFLERGYARDIAAFMDALYKASTWGELQERAPRERYEEAVERWTESKEDDEEGRSSLPLPRTRSTATRFRAMKTGTGPSSRPA